MNTMIRVSVDPSKIGHMMTEGKRVTITQPTYAGPDKITFYVECACGHPMGRRMTAAEAQAAMTPDGLIPYDGLCFECSAARDAREIPGLIKHLDNLAVEAQVASFVGSCRELLARGGGK